MPRDQWHEKAMRAVRPGTAFFTSAFVVTERIVRLQAREFFSVVIGFQPKTGSARTSRIGPSSKTPCVTLTRKGMTCLPIDQRHWPLA